MLQNKVQFNLTDSQLAYLSGFIDCDGSIMAQIVSRNDYLLKFQIRVSVVFYQKKRRQHFLTQIQNEIGVGTLRVKPDGMTELTIVGGNTVIALLKKMQPFLRMKKKQADLVIKIIEQLPLTKSLSKNSIENFIKLCQIADQVAELNDSKNRQITALIVQETLKLLNDSFTNKSESF